MEKDKDAVLPTYDEVLAKGMFDTEMLKRYLSNYPDSPRSAEIKFHLAENYRILQKYPESTDLYLACWIPKKIRSGRQSPEPA